MRRVLLGALVASSAFQAQAFSDETVYDFFVDRVDSSLEALKDEERELIEAKKKIKAAQEGDSKSEIETLKTQISDMEYQAALAIHLRDNVRQSVASKSGWTRRLDSATVGSYETKVKEANIAALALKQGESKVLEEKVFAASGYAPFQVVQKMSVVKEGDNDHKVVVSYAVKMDSSIPKKKWPSGLRTVFANMDEAKMEEFISKDLNEELAKNPYQVGKLEELQADETKRTAAFKNLDTQLSTYATEKVFGASGKASMNAVLSEKIKALGSKNKDLSEIWEKYEELSRITDTRGARDEYAELDAKYKIAKALRENPEIANNKEPCDVIVSILGKEGMKKLPNASRMECESTEKVEEVAKEVEKVEKEVDSKEQQRLDADTEKTQKLFAAHFEGCMARLQAMGQTTPAVSPQMTMVRSLYNGLLSKGAGCTYFGALMGDIVRDGAADDAFAAQLRGAAPYLMDAGVSEGDYADRAREVVKRQTPATVAGVDKLQKQRECLAKMESLSGLSLQSIANFSPTGNLAPEALQDPSVRQMLKFQEASKALIGAIDEELMLRNATGSGGLRAMGASGLPGQPQGPGMMGGASRSPVRVYNSNGTNTMNGGMNSLNGIQNGRGLSGNGTINNRMDSGTSRTNTRRPTRSTPPPNF